MCYHVEAQGGSAMHKIIFYVDRQGRSTLLDYIAELESSKSKDSRIKLTKIREYVKALAVNGTYLPETYCKHLDGEIWELRPISERILFAAWVDDAFVLLHSFAKKTQKTPKREIDQAKRELADFREREGKS
jgi:phage-related protein